MDDDVSHAVNARLTRLEEHAGLPPIGEEEPEQPDVEEPDEGNGDDGDEEEAIQV